MHAGTALLGYAAFSTFGLLWCIDDAVASGLSERAVHNINKDWLVKCAAERELTDPKRAYIEMCLDRREFTMHNGMHVVVAHMALVFLRSLTVSGLPTELLQLLAQRPQASHRGATQRVGRYAKTVLATCCVLNSCG